MKKVLAPAPPPFVNVECVEGMLPPRRESLLPLAPAKVCFPSSSAVAEHDSSDDDVAAVPSGLHNPEVANQLSEYLCKLAREGEYIGISGFVLFALRYRKRVHACFNMAKTELLLQQAPWATSVIADAPSIHAISCSMVKDEAVPIRSLHGGNPHTMNHRAAGYADKRN